MNEVRRVLKGGKIARQEVREWVGVRLSKALNLSGRAAAYFPSDVINNLIFCQCLFLRVNGWFTADEYPTEQKAKNKQTNPKMVLER